MYLNKKHFIVDLFYIPEIKTDKFYDRERNINFHEAKKKQRKKKL